jgi:hypothetical protein
MSASNPQEDASRRLNYKLAARDGQSRHPELTDNDDYFDRGTGSTRGLVFPLPFWRAANLAPARACKPR